MSGNPVVMVQDRFRELESGFRVWVSKQPLAVEAAVATLTSAAQGAVMGGLMGTLSPKDPAFPTTSVASSSSSSLKQVQALAGGPLVQARNFAVMTGVNAGISCVMKRIRGVEDLQTSMVAAFGSGAMFSLVSGMGGPNPAVNAVSSGLFFALIQGGLFQVGKKFSTPPTEDINYVQATNMLKSLGLDSYCKNFKKGMLNDNTLPLLTDSALSDVRIPPGPRLIILDHIRRDPELKKVRK